MRVTKSQIIHGVTDFVQTDIVPKMTNGRAMQIVVSIGANAIAANPKLADAILENAMVRAILDDDGSGTYELSGLMDAMTKAIRQFGSFPIHVPAIPLISPTEFVLNLSADDVDEMVERIEGDRPEE